MARRSEHSQDEIRSMAVRAAADLVSKEGVDALTARRVASQIGYTVGTLYWVFDNLEDLILHVNARTLDDLHSTLVETRNNSHEPHDSLLALAKTYLQYSEKNHGLWSLIFEHMTTGDELLPVWYKQRIDQIFSVVEKTLTSLEPEANRRVALARVLWSGVHGIAVLANSKKIDNDEVGSPERLLELQMDLFLKGLTCDTH